MSLGNPPVPGLPSAVFNAVCAMTYDSTAMAFKDALNNLVYLWIEQGLSTNVVQWNNATDSGQTNVRAQIPSLTATKILGGTYNSGILGFTYKSVNYGLRLVRDTSTGVIYAEAVAV